MRTSNSIEGRRAQEADAVVPPVLRLLITPGRRKPGSFVARLESSEQAIVAHSRQPVTDACRELLARGHDPAALLTMRHITKSHDSFAPLPTGQWAKWTYKEREKGGLAVERWMPFAVPRSGQKSGIEPAGVIPARPVAKIAGRRDRAPATAGAR
jgi:hypothetical protein